MAGAALRIAEGRAGGGAHFLFQLPDDEVLREGALFKVGLVTGHNDWTPPPPGVCLQLQHVMQLPARWQLVTADAGRD